MAYSGIISKMLTEHQSPIQYILPIGEYKLRMNELLGKPITLTWLKRIHCLKCGAIMRKSFAQGFCYPCFISGSETEDCVLRPELCRAHEGVARDMEYAKEHCLKDHFVYLALSSEIKVGVTRLSQIPYRWIDQGAIRAIKIAQTPNRYLAGMIEVSLKKHLTDKTNWRNMLVNKILENESLLEKKTLLSPMIPENLREYLCSDDTVVELVYPYVSIPLKVTSIDLEKEMTIRGTLTGIKGQYIIFDEGKVINIRKYGGYEVEVAF